MLLIIMFYVLFFIAVFNIDCRPMNTRVEIFVIHIYYNTETCHFLYIFIELYPCISIEQNLVYNAYQI